MSNTRFETTRRIIDELRMERDNWRLLCQQAEEKLADLDVPCVWAVDEDNWLATGCGSAFENKPGPFCPECRHPIEVRTWICSPT